MSQAVQFPSQQLLHHGTIGFAASLMDPVQASQQDGDIKKDNVAVAVVGKDQPFTLLSGDTLEPFVAQLEAEQPAAPAEGAAGQGEGGAEDGAEGNNGAEGGNGADAGDAAMDEA